MMKNAGSWGGRLRSGVPCHASRGLVLPERRAPRQVLRQEPLLAETPLGLDKAMKLAEILQRSDAIQMLLRVMCRRLPWLKILTFLAILTGGQILGAEGRLLPRARLS